MRATFEAAPAARSHVAIGLGDDAAALAFAEGLLVATVDASVCGTHFDLAWMSLGDVGYRATMAAASDLAAMGAEPTAILSALTLPGGFEDAALDELARGQADAARELGCPIVGGNLARGPALSITTTVLGRAAARDELLTRGGARAGDALFLAGPVGLARAGLLGLQRGLARDPGHARDALAPALHAFRRPIARIDAGRLARVVATAAIDVSDGLAQDAMHLAVASDVTLVFDAAALCGSELLGAAAALGESARELAFTGGEDYALLVAAPGAAASRLAGFVRVGGVEAPPRGGAARVVWVDETGARAAMLAPGFDHFAPSRGDPRDERRAG